jgi:2-oxoglutarate ferredoxin oxidoreductase subunit beta
MLAVAKGSAYIERTAVNSPANILKTKKAIAKAFRIQSEGYGFSLVEVLSPCPTNWKMNPVDACKWIDEVVTISFPLGVLKDITGDKKDAH